MPINGKVFQERLNCLQHIALTGLGIWSGSTLRGAGATGPAACPGGTVVVGENPGGAPNLTRTSVQRIIYDKLCNILMHDICSATTACSLCRIFII